MGNDGKTAYEERILAGFQALRGPRGNYTSGLSTSAASLVRGPYAGRACRPAFPTTTARSQLFGDNAEVFTDRSQLAPRNLSPRPPAVLKERIFLRFLDLAADGAPLGDSAA